MSTQHVYTRGPSDPFPEDEVEDPTHSAEPWMQDGRYIRDADGAIVVRGRTHADARRIVAAVNATRDIPTEALEGWVIHDVSEPSTRPNLEVELEVEPPSPFAVKPPAPRRAERRRAERRKGPSAPYTDPDSSPLLFDRRVMERRFAERRAGGL